MRWWRRHAGVRVRSTVAAAASVALALALAMLGGWWLLQQALTNAAEDAVTARAQEVAALVQQEGTAALDPERQPVFGEVIQVLGGAGQVVAAAPPSAARLRLVGTLPAPGQIVTAKVPALRGSGVDEPYMVAVQGVRAGVTGADVVVVVGRNVEGLSETLGLVGKLGLIGSPVLILVAAAVTYRFTGRALGPVEEMRRRVQTITSRRLDDRVPVPAVDDEIGRLAETMNGMLASLQAAQDAQRRFVADAGHELRSPLATIATTLEVARTEGDLTPERVRLLDDLTAETSRMGRLVDGLTLLARADEHGLRLRATDVDLDELVDAEVRRLRLVGGREVSVHTEPVRVTGDRDRLAQVLRNLTDNARRHAHSRVHLDLRRNGTQAVIRVEDDGPGVPAEDRARVFERFVRLDESRHRGSGGSGLGLAIVSEIVTGHAGQVSMQSSALGGAAVEVLLPVPSPPSPQSG